MTKKSEAIDYQRTHRMTALELHSGSGAPLSQISAQVKGCRMSAPTRRTNECSRPLWADVGQPLQGGNRVGCRRAQISAQAMGI